MNNSDLKRTSETETIMLPVPASIKSDSKNIITAPSKNTLPILLENSELVKSHSMNLIDDTTAHLFESMKALGKDTNVHALHENVKAACSCADQIHKLLRLKLDVIKLAGKRV